MIGIDSKYLINVDFQPPSSFWVRGIPTATIPDFRNDTKYMPVSDHLSHTIHTAETTGNKESALGLTVTLMT